MAKDKDTTNNAPRAPRRYTFLNFEERVNKVDSTVQIATIQYSRRAENIADNSTHFLEELAQIRNNFDICDDFVYFFNEVYPKVQSPEMLLYNLESVIECIVYHVTVPNSLATKSILHLIAVLSRDMRGELIRYYDKLLSAILSLMDLKEPEKTSEVFQTLILMFRNLNGKDIFDNISIIRKYYGPLFGSKAEFVRQFACESYCYLLRHMRSSAKRATVSAESSKMIAKEQVKDQIKELTIVLKAVARKASISENMTLGISSLLFESIRGVSNQARHHGIDIYKALLEIVIGKKSLDKTSTIPTASFIEVWNELQYALSEYIAPTKNQSFIQAIREALDSSDASHRMYMIDTLNIWLQYRNGCHIDANAPLFDYCMSTVKSTLTMITDDDKKTCGNLFSFTYSLWLYSKNSGNMKVTLMNKIINLFVSVIKRCTIDNSYLILKIHEFATFLFHSFQTCSIGASLTSTLLQAILGYISRIQDHAFYVDYALPLLADCLDEIEESELQALCSNASVKTFLLSSAETLTTASAISLKEQSLLLHMFTSFHYTSTPLQEYCMEEVKRLNRMYESNQTRARIAFKEIENEQMIVLAELITLLLQSIAVAETSVEEMVSMIHECLAVFHFYPTILASIARGYSAIPASYRTESQLASFLEHYSVYLMNSSHIIRQSWLQLFLSFTQCEYVMPTDTNEVPAYIGITDTFQMLANAEEQPFNLEGESQRQAILQRVVTPAMLKLLNPTMFTALIYYFLGLYTMKWSPLWKYVTTTLETFCKQNTEIVWNCMKRALFTINGYSDESGHFFTQEDIEQSHKEDETLLTEQEETTLKEEGLEKRYQERVRSVLHYGLLRMKRSFQLSNAEEIAFGSVENSYLWNSIMTLLANLSSVLFKYNREFITLFLLFIRDHYYASERRDDPYASLYKGNDYIKENYCCVHPCVHSKESNRRLVILLKMLANLNENVKNCYASEEIEKLIHNLLMRNDSEIQKQCLTITCHYHSKEVKPYMEQLEMMCDDNKFRECITTFFMSKEEGMILNDHRPIVIPVIIHILYGRLISRGNSSRLPATVRHASILTYLSSLESSELKEFVYITSFGFFSSVDFPAPTTAEEVSSYVKLLENREGITMTRIAGLLNLLYEVIKYMGMKLKDYIHIYLLIESYCLKRIQRELAGDMDVNEDGVATNESEEVGEEVEEEEEAKQKRTSQHQTEMLRKNRTLCIKRIIESIGYYSFVDYRLYREFFFDSLTPLLTILPQSTAHANKTPSLIHLAYIISCNSVLYYIYTMQPLLLTQTLACLSFAFNNRESAVMKERGYLGTLCTATATEIIQIIENLLTIDPENDYFNERYSKKKKNVKNWESTKDDLEMMQQSIALNGMEVEISEKEQGLNLLLPHVTNVMNGIEYLLTVIQSSKSNLFNRLLSIIYHLSQLASEGKLTLPVECLQRLFLLLVSFLRFSNNRENVLNFHSRIIDAICSLIPLLNDFDEGIQLLCELLYPNKYRISDLVIRRRIIHCFEVMQDKLPALKKIVPYLQNLHSTSKDSIGSYSFAKIGDVYDVLVKEGIASFYTTPSSFLPFYACILNQVTEDDMMIRTTSMQCIQTFIQTISPELVQSSSTQGQFYHSIVLLTIKSCKYIIKNTNNDNIRRPVVALMRLIAITFKSLHMTAFNSDLLPLINEINEEEDILLNLINIQTRTRVKGLRQLNAITKATRTGEQEKLSGNCIRNLLLPLIFAYIREYNKTLDSQIREECALTIGFLAEMMNWGHYISLFRKVYNSIYTNHTSHSYNKAAAENDTYVKLYIRILCLITEHFSFEINDLTNFENVISEKMALTAQDSLSAKALKQIQNLNRPTRRTAESSESKQCEPTEAEKKRLEEENEMELEQELKEENENEDHEIQAKELTLETKKKILRLVLTVVIPDLRQLMVQVDERKNQLVRSSVSMAIIQILLKLPKQMFDIYLPGVIQIVVLCLKQKMQSNRDEARRTLVNILKLLGVKYLHLVLSQMKYALTEGNQLFVLSYSLADMVQAITESAKCPVEQVIDSSVVHEEKAVTAESLDAVKYPLLRSLPLIHEIVVYDLFEDGARTREVEELKAASKANYHELAVCRSYDTWETVTSVIPFLPNPAIHFWMAPVFQRIINCENLGHLEILRKLLKSSVAGLLKNTSIQKSTLIAYCISLMTDAEKEIESQKEMDKQIQNTTQIWVTGEINKRITSDGRQQLLVEPERKLTGDNTSEARRRKINKTGKTELMGFGFQLLNSAMSQSFYVMKEDTEYFELTIDHILFVLRCCRNNDVINDCLTLTNTLLLWRLDSFVTNIDALRELLFSMLADFNTATAEMTRSLFHTITVIYRQFPKTAMSDKQARALIMLIKRDLNLPEKQNAAFGILRVILDRKITISEVYDLMDELSVLLLQSFNDSVRNQCSRVLLSFLMNYPMSNNRIEKLITFLLKNLDYDEPSGRLALAHLIQNMLTSLPADYLNSVSDMFFIPLLLRFMKETDKMCKVVIQEATKKLADRIDVTSYKKLFTFCFKWVGSNDMLIQRTGVMGILFLIQGRGQIVKGGLDVVLALASCLPATLSEMKQKENPVLQQEAVNLQSTEDSEDLLNITVGDEYCSKTDEFSLYTLNLTSKNTAVDWVCFCMLLMECYARFPEPCHDRLRGEFDLLSHVSLLLLSEHIFIRTSAVQFLHTFITTEVTSYSLCDQSWLQEPGSVFYLLQRLFISYHLTSSLQYLASATDLLTALILLYSEKENAIIAPQGLYNKELRVLGETRESDVLKRVKNVEAIRQLYNLDDLVDSEDSDVEDAEDAEDAEDVNMTEEADDMEKEDKEEDSEDAMEVEEVKKPSSRILFTLKRVPNPHRVVDCLYLLGSTLALNDVDIKKEILRAFDLICSTYTAEQITENIIPLLRPLLKVVNNSSEKEQELVEIATEIINRSIEGKLDKSTYIKYYSQIQDDMGQKKGIKKMQVKQLAVLNPKKYMERKRKKAMSAKESKKRKKMIQKGQIRIN